MAPELTHARLREVLSYEPETGRFSWRVNAAFGMKAGDEAGCLRPDGYRKLSIDGKQYRGARLAWFYVYGEWPPLLVDHIDGDRANDRIGNLRLANKSQNAQNSKKQANNRSGYRGVSWSNVQRQWRAYITIDGKTRHLGYFDDVREAAEEYIFARMDYHPFQHQYSVGV